MDGIGKIDKLIQNLRELARKIVWIDLERTDIDHNLKEIERKETIGNLMTFALVLFGAILGAAIIKEIFDEIASE